MGGCSVIILMSILMPILAVIILVWLGFIAAGILLLIISIIFAVLYSKSKKENMHNPTPKKITWQRNVAIITLACSLTCFLIIAVAFFATSIL